MMKKKIDAAAKTVTFSFEDGLEPVVFRADLAGQANREYAMMHGFCQRIGDAAAIQKSAENGYRVTEAMRRAEIVAMVEHYEAGSDQWELRARATPKVDPFLSQMAAQMGVSIEEAKAKLAAMVLQGL